MEIVHGSKIKVESTIPQSTISLSGYKNDMYSTDSNFSANKIININTILGITGNPLISVDMSKQGVGSGAGYIEVSNGTYTVYNEDSNGNFTTEYTN